MKLRAFAKQHALVLYFIIAFAGSWVVMIPLALSAQKLIPSLPLSLHYLSAYGPLLSALIVTWLADGGEGLRELVGRMLKWRVGWVWIIVSISSPIVLYALGLIGALLVDGKLPEWARLGQLNFLPDIGIAGALLLWIFNSGIGEETGWRGFALPRLQKSQSALSATVVLGLFWSLWHLPAFFYLPSYEKVGLIIFPGFALGVISGAILLTWLYNSTRGSILMVVLWHGVWNLVSAPPVSTGTVAAVASTVVMVWAVLTVIVFKPANLSRAEKQVI